MRALVREKELAVLLRKRGYSYRDILKSVPVAKSTLSDWLKDAPLTRIEKAALKRRRDGNITRGRIRAAAALSALRLKREHALLVEARAEYKRFVADPWFRTGVALYWAEGTKRHGGFAFTNSDVEMMRYMVVWTETFLKLPRINMKARLYIHKPYAHENLERYWSARLEVPMKNFRKTIYKPTGLLVKKRPGYKGCLKIIVDKTSLRLKMLFWQNMLVEEHQER
ncbi:MAG TPA: hypothetical protein VJK53_04115 [Candidatus Paceibacterota bacterium]